MCFRLCSDGSEATQKTDLFSLHKITILRKKYLFAVIKFTKRPVVIYQLLSLKNSMETFTTTTTLNTPPQRKRHKASGVFFFLKFISGENNCCSCAPLNVWFCTTERTSDFLWLKWVVSVLCFCGFHPQMCSALSNASVGSVTWAASGGVTVRTASGSQLRPRGWGWGGWTGLLRPVTFMYS